MRAILFTLIWFSVTGSALRGQIFLDPGFDESEVDEKVESSVFVQEDEDSFLSLDGERGEEIGITIDEAVDPDELVNPLSLLEKEESKAWSRYTRSNSEVKEEEFEGSLSGVINQPKASGTNAALLIVTLGFAGVCILGVVIWILEHGTVRNVSQQRRRNRRSSTSDAPY
ncbi:MAG: hypothetical protein ACI9R3_001571 [Verrucomicrobiales bacterium]|jgi:hypothetical protein